MPDWTYQTVFKPILFRLQPDRARGLAVGNLGRLGRFWLGRRVVQFMGHMLPDRRLGFQFKDVYFPSRIGLGCGLDSDGSAIGGFDQFGLAFLEYGPITEHNEKSTVEFTQEPLSICLPTLESNPGIAWVQDLESRLTQQQVKTPILLRLHHSLTDDQLTHIVASSRIDGFILGREQWRQIGAKLPAAKLALLLVSPDEPSQAPEHNTERLDGVFIDGSLREDSGRKMTRDNVAATETAISSWRNRLGSEQLIVANGSLVEPVDAVRLMKASADLVVADFGMVVAGPGFAKRCNEAILQTCIIDEPVDDHASESMVDDEQRPSRQSWFWSLLMGIAMLGGGLLAMAIALTRVVLPYDESVAGMTREELLRINDRLLDFMAHDRVTLAGTMLSVGILYTGLSWFGCRRGAHWAQQSIVLSAFAGFFSFFLFLGFGYFDPFHAFVTTVLFQFLLLTLYARLPRPSAPIRLDLHNDAAWRWAQWGQLMYVMHGAALITAGTVICRIGISHVFIKEDMEFLCTTPEKLLAANPQLLGLVAHDRATFGGMLISTGITVLLASMWGFRRGCEWLWWTLLLGALAGYVSTIAIHLNVGYTSFKHLLPAYGGLIWVSLSAWFSYRFMHDSVQEA